MKGVLWVAGALINVFGNVLINLGTNAHLDEAYGGYCVFAQVEDDASFAIVDAIAAAVKSKGKVAVTRITCP